MNDQSSHLTQKPAIQLIFIYGKPGAGKDTAAEWLSNNNPDWAPYSTGNTIKEAQDPNHLLHEIVKPHIPLIKEGVLFPPEVILDPNNPEASIIPSFIEGKIEEGTTSTIISTGFPRSIEQLDNLSIYLKNLRQTVDISEKHLYIDVDDYTSISRQVKRYRKALMDPERTPRSDDNARSVRKRVKDVFRKETIPVLEDLEARNMLLTVSGQGSEEEVYELVREKLEGPSLRSPEGIIIPNGIEGTRGVERE